MNVGADDRPDFEYTPLKFEKSIKPSENDISIFLVQVKSDTDVGHDMLMDPVKVLEERAEDMGLRKGETRAMVLRVNAEVRANPRHRSEVWVTYPGDSRHAVCIQFKYDPEDA